MMSLPARQAALRLARNRHRDRRRRGAWRRVVLRWRRRRPDRDPGAGSIATMLGIWAPHLHLRFAIHASGGGRGAAASPALATRTPVASRRTAARGTSARPAPAWPVVPAPSREPPTKFGRSVLPAARGIDIARVTRAPHPQAGPAVPGVQAAIGVVERLLLQRRLDVVHVSRRSERFVSLEAPRVRRAAAIAVCRPRAAVGPRPVAAEAPLVLRSERRLLPTETTWRRGERPPGAATVAPGARAPVPTHAGAAPRVDTAAAPTPLRPSGAPATLPAASLEPAVLDRLADDVIRRVERRVRIERERRGL